MTRFLAFLLGICLLFLTACGGDTNTPAEFTLSERPSRGNLLFDYTGIFSNIEESTRRYLESLKNMYGIEACIVSLATPPDQQTIQQLAAILFSNWNIGRDQGGRGLLFLFIDSDKEVKLEVGYELEDVFTDAFTGFIEDLQLRPNYRSGDLEVGIIAVFEEIEKRAEIKKLGEYSPESIAEYDSELLSGGGGAGKKLSAYQESASPNGTAKENLLTLTRSSATTPGTAFEIMLGKWAGKNKHPEVDIYTEATKMAMGDQNNPEDKRVSSQAKTLLGIPYSVKQDRNVALIHFNRKKGWQYAPYLFANDGTGWKFDIVSQRKYVVFGSKDSWHLERGDHPYNGLFGGFKNGLRKDLPYSEDVSYHIGDDQNIADSIKQLEQRLTGASGLDNADSLELGRLGVVTARRPQHVYTPLNTVKSKSPGIPDTYKYLAVYHVMSNFQYESALQEIKKYNQMTKTVFGLNAQGFIEHKLQDYGAAADTLNKSLKISPSLYAWCKLSRAEAMLFQQTTKLDPRRIRHKQNAIKAFTEARQVAPESWRVAMLEQWLHRKRVLGNGLN